MDTTSLSIDQFADSYRVGEFSPIDAVRACIERISVTNPTIKAYCHLDELRAMALAEESTRRFARGKPLSILDGIPCAVKDVFFVEGWPTRRGSRITSKTSAEFTSPCVARVLEDGAVIVGKTTTAELGWKAVTDSPLTGITVNPLDPSRTAGGSSGGSAAAVALGTVPFALGTDAGGSIRIPAAFCGVVGMIATYGRVPLWPIGPLSVLVHAGPLARSVRDAALVLSAISRPDSRYPAHDRWYQPIDLDLVQATGPVRIGVLTAAAGQRPDPSVQDRFRLVLDALGDAGHWLSELRFDSPIARQTFEVLWSAGHARMLEMLGDYDPTEVDPGLLDLARRGRATPAIRYLEAEANRRTLQEDVSRLFDDVDFIISPTVGVEPFEAGLNVPPEWPDENWWSWASFTYLINLAANPALSVPIPDNHAIPFGLQVVAAHGNDERLLQFGQTLESMLDYSSESNSGDMPSAR